MDKLYNIPGFEDIYKIDKKGQVFSCRAKKYLKPWKNAHGYYSVSLCINNKPKTWPVHRLVIYTFLGIKNNRLVSNHIDGNPQNNRLDNLELVTQARNIEHALDMGLTPSGERSYLSKLSDREVEVIKQLYSDGYYTQPQIAKMFGTKQQNISQIINNKSRKRSVTKMVFDRRGGK